MTGRRPWKTDAAIRTIWFTCDRVRHIIDHPDTLSKLAIVDNYSADDAQIIGLDVGGKRYKIFYRPTIVDSQPWPSEVSVGFSIELDEAVTIEFLVSEAQKILSFFSFCLADNLQPDEVSFSPLRVDEFREVGPSFEDYLFNAQY